MIGKREYNKAIKIVNQYNTEQSKLIKKKRESGYYSILYQLKNDEIEFYRERLIKASSPNEAINKFMKKAPLSLKWVDEDVKMNNEYYYIGDNPAVLNYL